MYALGGCAEGSSGEQLLGPSPDELFAGGDVSLDHLQPALNCMFRGDCVAVAREINLLKSYRAESNATHACT